MAASSTTAKSQSVSYAERAKRARSSAPSQTAFPTPPTSNGTSQATSSEVTSPSLLSRNLTPSSSVILTRPGSPPLGDPSPEKLDAEHSRMAALPKSPSKPAQPNVWTMRKEQLAQRAAGGGPFQANPTSPKEQLSSKSNRVHSQTDSVGSMHSASSSHSLDVASTRRQLPNGISSARPHDDIHPGAAKGQDDPLVARVASRPSNVAPLTPPSLDDVESWPEMGKVSSVSASASHTSHTSHTSVEIERKDVVSAGNGHKKGEKTKWVAIPAEELQAAADALSSQPNSRAQSQHRRNQKSHSRQPSQNAGSSRPAVVTQQIQRQANVRDRRMDSRGGSVEVSASHSRADSVANSRAPSTHSSPMFGSRGRRLPDEIPGVPNLGISVAAVVGQVAGPSSFDPSSSRAPFENRHSIPSFNGRRSQAQSQSHTPYSSHSPAYHNPPSGQGFRGGSPVHTMYPPFITGAYPVPQQGDGQEFQQNDNFSGYASYVVPNQQGFPPYVYHAVPPFVYGPPPPHIHGQPEHFPLYNHQSGMLGTDSSAAPSNPVGSDDFRPGVLQQDFSTEAAPTIPPASLRSRPPPPDQSEALAGYRNIVPMPISPLLNPQGHSNIQNSSETSVEVASVPREAFVQASPGEESDKSNSVVFGSIRPGGVKSPSPASSPRIDASGVFQGGLEASDPSGSNKGPHTAYSIGFRGAGPKTIRIKSKRSSRDDKKFTSPSASGSMTLSVSGLSTSSSGESVEANGQADSIIAATAATESRTDSISENPDVVVNVIDLTGRASKWEFGTTSRVELETAITEGQRSRNFDEVQQGIQDMGIQEVIIHGPQPMMIHNYPSPQFLPQHMGFPPVHLHVPMNVVPQPSSPQEMPPAHHIPTLAPLNISHSVMSPLNLSSPGPVMSATQVVGDEWEVRDFGYGFGTQGGYMADQERMEYERYQDGDRVSRDFIRDRNFNGFAPTGRGRRGGFGSNGFSGYSGGYEGRGGSFEGRGFGGRRGRGFGRGSYNPRGRGAYARHQNPHHPLSQGSNFQNNPENNPALQAPPMQVPPPQQQPFAPEYINTEGYYTLQQEPSPFATSPYGTYAPPPPPFNQPAPGIRPQSQSHPPVPSPVTPISFPIDPLRHQVLGQLEYYFSEQNLAQDLFLRRQMDSRGWVPIQLIASFNRIKQLTMDVQLVHDVLGLSSLVEVRDTFVRLANDQWKHYVLPDAPGSTVEGDNAPMSGYVGEETVATEFEGDNEEDDEDDVVFVMHEATTRK